LSPAILTGTKALIAKLKTLGIETDFDLLLHFPIRYEDHSRLWDVSGVIEGEAVQVEGIVLAAGVQERPRRSLKATLDCGSGVLQLRFLHFYPGHKQLLSVGNRLRVFGTVRQGYSGREMVQPKCRQVVPGEPMAPGLTPIYPVKAGIRSITLAKRIQALLVDFPFADLVPGAALDALGLPGLRESLYELHRPQTAELQGDVVRTRCPAWRRVKFDELLAQQLSMRTHYLSRLRHKAPRMDSDSLGRQLEGALPFPLTSAQAMAIAAIRADLAREVPMQRLLQGDVGCGKTIIAVLAALQAVESGFQVAFMSPTETLAEQHYQKLSAWLRPLGIELAWLAGAMPKQEQEQAARSIHQGAAQIAIGTHALFQQRVAFKRLGLVIIDEQQKFGVHQRLALQQKGTMPHQLMLSATPIPRTLSMSYFANLDVTTINELPPGRKPVATRLVRAARRDQVVDHVREICASGRQAYWVCPLIEGSATLQLQAVTEVFQTLVEELHGLRVELVHGRMKSAEKAEAMTRFMAGEAALLVATTVIEVGVDVPNASLMVIENAERMGLAQLHQLRGRVGRGGEPGTCILLYQEPLSADARQRLRIIYENSDGFEVARQDMLLRGTGELLGIAQSGAPMLRFADIEQDQDLLVAAKVWAEQMLERSPDAARKHMSRWLGARANYLHV
jgi:ATP-dependent DNA helicase RecG